MNQLFWDWFSLVEEDIYNNIEKHPDEFAYDIKEHLKEIHPHIEFEISFEIVDEKRNFVISADGIFNLFDVVLNLVNSAPYYKRWNIVAFRPRLHQKNQVIELDGVSLDYDDIYFLYQESDYNKLNLDVYIRGFDGDDNRYIHVYFILLDSLIGEYDAVTLIEMTTILPLDNDMELLGFRDLIDIVDELKERNIN